MRGCPGSCGSAQAERCAVGSRVYLSVPGGRSRLLGFRREGSKEGASGGAPTDRRSPTCLTSPPAVPLVHVTADVATIEATTRRARDVGSSQLIRNQQVRGSIPRVGSNNITSGSVMNAMMCIVAPTVGRPRDQPRRHGERAAPSSGAGLAHRDRRACWEQVPPGFGSGGVSPGWDLASAPGSCNAGEAGSSMRARKRRWKAGIGPGVIAAK